MNQEFSMAVMNAKKEQSKKERIKIIEKHMPEFVDYTHCSTKKQILYSWNKDNIAMLHELLEKGLIEDVEASRRAIRTINNLSSQL